MPATKLLTFKTYYVFELGKYQLCVSYRSYIIFNNTEYQSKYVCDHGQGVIVLLASRTQLTLKINGCSYVDPNMKDVTAIKLL